MADIHHTNKGKLTPDISMNSCVIFFKYLCHIQYVSIFRECVQLCSLFSLYHSCNVTVLTRNKYWHTDPDAVTIYSSV